MTVVNSTDTGVVGSSIVIVDAVVFGITASVAGFAYEYLVRPMLDRSR